MASPNYWVSATTGAVYCGDCIPGDTAATSAQVTAWQTANTPPITVSAWQAKAILAQTPFSSTGLAAPVVTVVGSSPNFLAAANALIAATATPTVQAYWAYATQFSSNDSSLVSIGQALGLTTAQITAMFQAASALTV